MGDKSAFQALYTKYWDMVFNNAYKRLGNLNLSEDVVQEVFSQLWLRREQEQIRNLPAYLYIATRNQVYKLQRKEQIYIPITEIAEELRLQRESADAQILYKELLETYRQLIEHLPPQQREIFKLRYDENLETNEIAEQLKISPKTVRNQLGRALSRLKTAFTFLLILTIYMLLKVSGSLS
ncbi:RNA polymerase sigma-70 factor [Olivibacter ginsenosidimutans]|uniref:RNA polymerase sigma-70 factor n=2 Tax=Olivibacter ginsenosidimutans TaxID=1176537 RepID=A0ABP9CF53_9SPHI